MAGKPFFNYKAFNEAAAYWKARGANVFNPAQKDVDRYGEEIFTSNPDGDPAKAVKEHGFNLRETLTKDLEWIGLEADAVYFLRGWEKSSGARAEHALATALNLNIIYQGAGS